MTSGSVTILIIFIIYFLLTGLFCSFKRWRTRNGNGGSIHGSIIGGRLSRRRTRRLRNRGLDPAVIQTFPIFEYSVVKGLRLGRGALECAVCISEFQDDDKIRLLPKCDHVFHPDCIDAWFSNRTTCPVCRANLVPESAETNATTVAVGVAPLERELEGDIRGSETEDAENQPTSVHVIIEEEPPREVAVGMAPLIISPIRSDTPHGTPRSTKPRYAGRFPRSNSTGHSVVQPGEDIERFTLRLPVDVRKQLMNKRLNHTSSMMVLLVPMEGSTRRGQRMTGEGSSRGRREGWMFSMMPSFMRRASPAPSPRMTAEGNATVTPPRAKPFMSPMRGSTTSDGTGQSLIPSAV